MVENERIAILETNHKNIKDDINVLFKIFREHMEKEENQRDQLIAEIVMINHALTKQKAFIAGVGMVISIIWAIVVLIIK